MDGRQRQTQIYVDGVAGARPKVPIDFDLLEDGARKAMSDEAFAYVRTGAGRERTMAANREGFERWRIVQRVLRDVSERDLGIELFGRRLASPLLLAPIGVLEMAHADADLAVARAAAQVGVPMIISNQASTPTEEIAGAMGEGAPRWFQLYWSTSNELVESLVGRAEDAGCEAIVVTLDTTMLGWRTRDLDLAYLPFLRGKGIAQYTSDPVFREMLSEPPPKDAPEPKPSLPALKTLLEVLSNYPEPMLEGLRSGEARAAVQRFVQIYSRPSLTWKDLPFLRERTSLPILLKGIIDPEDARRALDAGVDGIYVSNHGGRQVDGAVGAVDALPGVVEAVDGEVPVLLDSGIRGGADAYKALALGATAVCIGRPYVYALALAGEEGVRELLHNYLADLDLTVGLAGHRTVEEIDAASLAAVDELPLPAWRR